MGKIKYIIRWLILGEIKCMHLCLIVSHCITVSTPLSTLIVKCVHCFIDTIMYSVFCHFDTFEIITLLFV